MTTRTSAFKTFPEFSKLTLADKGAYNALLADYPPVSEFSFPTLMNWWDSVGECSISLLHGNIVLSYWLPGDTKYSGLSIIGTNRLDESICTIFDYLRDQGQPARLVHVPEFVIANLQYPELFKIHSERRFDEYILSLSRFYPLNHMVSYRRMRLRKFMSHVKEESLSIRQLDLALPENQELLLDLVTKWQQKGTINNFSKKTDESSRKAIIRAEETGIENLCLFVDGKIQGFCLYHLPRDKRYVDICHAKINTEIPHTIDYLAYSFARWFADRGVMYVNIAPDFGVPHIRMFKMALGPSNFFRKYIVVPANRDDM